MPIIVQPCAVPADAALAQLACADAYTDCYTTTVGGRISQADYVEAFYTTPVFRLERAVLALLSCPSSDREAAALARGDSDRFAAWQVDHRAADQLLLAAGRTRSWLAARPCDGVAPATVLFFGSAVMPRNGGRGGRPRLGWQFRLLLGFHRLYSRVLLRAAARRVARR